jgi:hypothetical protein
MNLTKAPTGIGAFLLGCKWSVHLWRSEAYMYFNLEAQHVIAKTLRVIYVCASNEMNILRHAPALETTAETT